MLGLTSSHGAAWDLYLETCAGGHGQLSALAMVSQKSRNARGSNACLWATYNTWGSSRQNTGEGLG